MKLNLSYNGLSLLIATLGDVLQTKVLLPAANTQRNRTMCAIPVGTRE